MRRALIVAACGLAATGPAHAQRLSGQATVSYAEHRVDAGTGLGLEVSKGPLVTVAGTYALLPRLTVGVAATGGNLQPDGTGEERDVAQLAFTARVPITGGIAAAGSVASRTYTAPIARQAWTIVQLGLEGRMRFGAHRLTGVGRLAYLPVVSVNGLDNPDLAIAAAAGVEYHGGSLTWGLEYWLERSDFGTQTVGPRLEQLTGLALRVSVAVGRK